MSTSTKRTIQRTRNRNTGFDGGHYARSEEELYKKAIEPSTSAESKPSVRATHQSSPAKEAPAMYQTNPTEIVRERQLALLREAEDRRFARGLRKDGLKPQPQSERCLEEPWLQKLWNGPYQDPGGQQGAIAIFLHRIHTSP